VRPLAAYLRSLDPRLPRDVYVLELGALVNAFGNGVVLPFLLIYLHNVRGIPFGLAGSAAAAQSATALGSGFLGGTLSDRLGPKRVLLGSLAVMTVAFALMPLIRTPWHAFAIYTLWGLGSGSFWPSQSALLAGMTPATRRAPAYALQRLAMNVGVALGGVVAGLIASVGNPGSFTILFAIDCVTFVGYMLVLARIRAPALHEGRLGGSWRAVLRDRVFTVYTLLNAAFMTAAISLVVELLPAFGKNVTGISEKEVGIVFALDAVGVVLFQLPVVKLAEGRRRMRGFALMGTLWAATLLGVWAAGSWTRATEAFGILAAVMLLFAVGECLHGAIHAPLSVDLAPPQLVGRYTAAASISWQIGWIVGPAAGGFLLQHRPLLLWPIAAVVNLLCAACALALEPRLPERVRRTPQEETAVPMPLAASG
jgi:MFS family permease